MKKECVICKKEFEAQRSDAEACSSACRQKHWRNKKDVKKEPVMTAEEHWETLQNGSNLSAFLLRHPNHETVRLCCLHFLGDDHQKLAVFMKEKSVSANQLIEKFNRPLPVIVTDGTSKEIVIIGNKTIEVPTITAYEGYYEEITKSGNVAELNSTMREVKKDKSLSIREKEKLEIYATKIGSQLEF